MASSFANQSLDPHLEKFCTFINIHFKYVFSKISDGNDMVQCDLFLTLERQWEFFCHWNWADDHHLLSQASPAVTYKMFFLQLVIFSYIRFTVVECLRFQRLQSKDTVTNCADGAKWSICIDVVSGASNRCLQQKWFQVPYECIAWAFTVLW